jgi:PAS domain S-box-containing protein
VKKRRSEGDWASLAEMILDREGRPAAILDRGGRVRAANLALASLLGWARTEVKGKSWTDLCIAAGNDDELKRVRRLFEDVGQRGARGIEMPCRTRSGERLTLIADIQTVGPGGRAGLLLTAQEVRPSPGAAVTAGGGFQYEVSWRDGEFGILKRVIAFGDGTRVPMRRHCYEALYARDSPCPGCPAPRLEPGTVRALTSVVRRREPQTRFDVTSAHVSGGDDALVTAWPIDEEMLRQLIAAKVDDLALNGSLSERERAVLDLLLLGRSREEIAAALRISVSTVKYHQRNLERKMGADSRIDLFRLVLF